MRPIRAEFLPTRGMPLWANILLTVVLACFAGYEGYQAWDATLQSRALGEQAERLKAVGADRILTTRAD